MNSVYYAEHNVVDFSSMSTMNLINNWVSLKTNDKIDKIIQDFSNLDDVREIVVNAVYFKGDWANPFDKNQTKMADFNGLAGSQYVNMMHTTASNIGYLDDDSFESVCLPYANKRTVMVIMMPKEDQDILEFSQNLTYGQFRKTFNGANATVDLSLPKFSIEASPFSIENTLSEMGFKLSNVDLSAIGINERQSFSMFQCSKTDINEEGTEVAVATWNMGVTIDDDIPNTAINVKFNVNRPFLYFIVDKLSGAIILSGRVCSF
jgi:serpin B